MSIPSKLIRLDGTELSRELIEDQVVLFVNVASKCGYTKQYSGLVDLHAGFRHRGFCVIGVPCNQFGGQEPGSADEIAQFCSTQYQVDFPLLEKQDVNGANRSELYEYLIGNGPDIGWNFEKIIVGRDGQIVDRFEPKVDADDSRLRTAIINALDT